MVHFIRSAMRRQKAPPQYDRAPVDGCEVTESNFGDLPGDEQAAIDAEFARLHNRDDQAKRVDPWQGAAS